ncbi:MAG: hypothetical protein H3C31_03860 [Brumimicrobium sp.]|nr:hypothetical protein [Brumimicrobium sp.]
MSNIIPKPFYSDVDGETFHHCKVCGESLYNGQPYSIEKAFKRIDEHQEVTIFEIAICTPCAEKQAAKMSKHSRAYMEQVMTEKGMMEKRTALWENNWEENWNKRCLLTNNEIKLNDEYHIIGNFVNGEVIPNAAPFVIGQELMEEIQENLSLETKEEMDRFGEQFLGPDPALRALLKDYQFVLV